MKTECGKSKMITLVWKGVSPGLAREKAFDVLRRDSELYEIDPAQICDEKARIEKAIDDVRQSLTIDAKHVEASVARSQQISSSLKRLCCLIPLLLVN